MNSIKRWVLAHRFLYRYADIQLQIQLIKAIPFISNFTSNPFLNFLVNVIDKVEIKYIKTQIKVCYYQKVKPQDINLAALLR